MENSINIAGFSWATTAQVESLFRSRGDIEGEQTEGGGGRLRALIIEDSIGDGWIDLDGAGSADIGIFYALQTQPNFYGWSRASIIQNNGLTAFARITFTASPADGSHRLDLGDIYDDGRRGSSQDIGFWLFRETRTVAEPPPPPPTGTVPLPSTLAILGLGLIGLMRTRFVKAK